MFIRVSFHAEFKSAIRIGITIILFEKIEIWGSPPLFRSWAVLPYFFKKMFSSNLYLNALFGRFRHVYAIKSDSLKAKLMFGYFLFVLFYAQQGSKSNRKGHIPPGISITIIDTVWTGAQERFQHLGWGPVMKCEIWLEDRPAISWAGAYQSTQNVYIWTSWPFIFRRP